MLKPLDPSRLFLALPGLPSFWAVWTLAYSPFPFGLPVNPTPPPLLTQVPPLGFCPEHGPQGFAFLTRALHVANST